MGLIGLDRIADWRPQVGAADADRWSSALEAGAVLFLPRLEFAPAAAERRFLDPRWSHARAKNIRYDPLAQTIGGAAGRPADLADLLRFIQRFHQCALGLIGSLFPRYVRHLQPGRASFRPAEIERRSTSWRKDDRRLHIDAFPLRPTRGSRILRVFANVDPDGRPRVWRIGEPFADIAEKFLPRVPAPVPGSAALLHWLRISKSWRGRCDHIMLHLHDRMKSDLAYQQGSRQRQVEFPAGSTWICFSDQVAHAAMARQFLMEQTVILPVDGLSAPGSAPLRVPEKLTGRALA
jgi:hypothetical protein